MMFEKLYGKTVTAIKAFGIDAYDFTNHMLNFGFSVGQFGYAVFEFDDDCVYLSIDGISSIVPPRKNIHEVPVHKDIIKTLVGAVLNKIDFDGDRWAIYFDGYDVLYGVYTDNDGMTDRSEFVLEFPWI